MSVAVPDRYKPVQQLLLCSVLLRNVRVPVALGSHPVLLIGPGDPPKVWLAAPKRSDSSELAYVVAENMALGADVEVSVNPVHKTVTVTSGDQAVLKASGAGESAIVHELDLHPLGLMVYGDDDGLQVGALRMSSMSFVDAETAVQAGVTAP
jgi:hypothetical protein